MLILWSYNLNFTTRTGVIIDIDNEAATVYSIFAEET